MRMRLAGLARLHTMMLVSSEPVAMKSPLADQAMLVTLAVW